MRRSIDVLRSLKRYVSLALGEEWEVNLVESEGTFSRPAARVIAATPQQVSGPRHRLDAIQTFSVNAFPVAGTTAEESLIAAAEVEETLLSSLRIGGVDEARAARIPLYDYDGTPWDEGSTTRREPDYARVLDLSVSRTASPADETLYTVSAEVRLGWSRDGAIPSGGRTVSDLRMTVD